MLLRRNWQVEVKYYGLEKTENTLCGLSQFTFRLWIRFGLIHQLQRCVLLTNSKMKYSILNLLPPFICASDWLILHSSVGLMGIVLLSEIIGWPTCLSYSTHPCLLSPWRSPLCTDDPGVTVVIWDLILTDLNDFWILPRLPTFHTLCLLIFLCPLWSFPVSYANIPISIVLSLTYLSHSLMKQGNRWGVFNEIRVWPALLNQLRRLKSKWLFMLDHAECKAVRSR